MHNNPNNPDFDLDNGKEEDFDLKRFLGKIVQSWWIYLLSLVICLALGVIYLKLATPQYNINATVLVDETSSKAGSPSASSDPSQSLSLSSLFGMSSNVDNEEAILKTNLLMQDVVKELNLNTVYFSRPYFTYQESFHPAFKVNYLHKADTVLTTPFYLTYEKGKPMEIDFTEQINGGSLVKKVNFDQPFFAPGVGILSISRNAGKKMDNGSYEFIMSSVDAKVADMLLLFSVSLPDEKATALALKLTYPIPGKGEMVMRQFINDYIRQDVANQNQIADSTLKFINIRLIAISKDLNLVEGNIQQFKQGNQLADISEQSKLLMDNTADYTERLAKIQTQLSILDAVKVYLTDDNKVNRVVPSSVIPNDPIFEDLVGHYNTLILDRDKQLLTSTESNPFVQNLDQQIEKFRKDLLTNLVNTRKSLVISKNDMQKISNKFQGQVYNVPQQERVFLDLKREQEIRQQLYLYLLQKREETYISKTSTISSARLIDPAKSEYLPYSPSKKIILAAAFLIALIIPTGRIIVIDFLNNHVQSKEDIQRITDMPIIGEISHNTTQENVVVLDGRRSAISEQFRALRTNLQFFINQADRKVILMTSSMSGEGKSFTAINLGMALALSGKKVALMELDLRKPNLSAKIGLPNDFGFTNYIISNDVKYKDIIQPVALNENLFVISSGPIPPNPTETILSDKMSVLMDELKKDFDYIVIDAPPIGLVTDAQLLSEYADLTLYLVRFKYTYKNQLYIAQELYMNEKIKKMALIVNDITIQKGYGYGYGYGYQYGYGYGYGSYGEKEPESRFKRLFKWNKKRDS